MEDYSSCPSSAGSSWMNILPSAGESGLKKPPLPKKSFSVNKNAILSLKNCLKRIGESSRRSSESSGSESISNSKTPTNEIGTFQPGSGNMFVAVGSKEENGFVLHSEETDVVTHSRIRRIRKFPVSSRPLHAETRSSLLQKYRHKRKIDDTKADPAVGPPFTTDVLDSFLEKAWLSYALFTKGDRLIFDNPHFQYSLTGAEIPEPFVRVVSFNWATASANACVKFSTLGLGRQKARSKKKEQAQDQLKTEEKEAETAQLVDNVEEPLYSVSNLWESAEFSTVDSVAQFLTAPTESEGHHGRISEEVQLRKKKKQKAAGDEFSVVDDDPFCLSVKKDPVPKENVSLSAGQSSVPSLSESLDAEEIWQLRRLCEACEFLLDEDTPVLTTIMKVKEGVHHTEEKLRLQRQEAETLLKRQKSLYQTLLSFMRANYKTEED